MITDLGHPAPAARDVEETPGFYRPLGAEAAFRLHNDDGPLMLAYLRVSGDRFIEMFPSGRHPTPAAQSFTRLCLLTDDPEGSLQAPANGPLPARQVDA
jgi:hypothetical protein